MTMNIVYARQSWKEYVWQLVPMKAYMQAIIYGVLPRMLDRRDSMDHHLHLTLVGWCKLSVYLDLVKDITSDPETLFTSMNLVNADDVQVGKWVQNQNKTRKIKYVAEGSLVWEIPQQDENENVHATSQ